MSVNSDYSRGSFDACLRYARHSLMRRTICTPPQSLAQALPGRQNSSREINRGSWLKKEEAILSPNGLFYFISSGWIQKGFKGPMILTIDGGLATMD
jgi:hypothetical protein